MVDVDVGAEFILDGNNAFNITKIHENLMNGNMPITVDDNDDNTEDQWKIEYKINELFNPSQQDCRNQMLPESYGFIYSPADKKCRFTLGRKRSIKSLNEQKDGKKVCTGFSLSYYSREVSCIQDPTSPNVKTKYVLRIDGICSKTEKKDLAPITSTSQCTSSF